MEVGIKQLKILFVSREGLKVLQPGMHWPGEKCYNEDKELVERVEARESVENINLVIKGPRLCLRGGFDESIFSWS